MIQNEDVLHQKVWTPYRELTRYRRLLLASTLLNLLLTAALVYCTR